MQLIAGCISSSSGTIEITHNQQSVDSENVFRYISFSAPYIDLPEELNGVEMLSFQHKFKPFIDDLSAEEILEYSGLTSAGSKPIRYFSSGMKQRLKVVLAMLCNVPVILLDEPTTNLDEAGLLWYDDLIRKYSRNRILIIASNQKRDYHFCEMRLNLMNYK
jgi:ABC-type multidrug transport system ATPase subunit